MSGWGVQSQLPKNRRYVRLSASAGAGRCEDHSQRVILLDEYAKTIVSNDQGSAKLQNASKACGEAPVGPRFSESYLALARF